MALVVLALKAIATEEPFLHFSLTNYEDWTYHRTGVNVDQNFILQGRVNLMVTEGGEMATLESPVFSGQGLDSIRVYVDYHPHMPYVAAKVALQVDVIDAMGNALSTVTQDISANVMQQDVLVVLAVPTDGNCSLLLSAPKADMYNCAAVNEVKVWSVTADEPVHPFDYFEFVDKDGNVVPNETTMTLTEVTTEEDVFGEVTSTMFSHLKLRNKTNETHYLRINMFIERIDNGFYQLCFPMACKTYDEVTNIVTEGGPVAANELKDLMTEWIPTGEGGCDVTLTVEVLNMTGPILNPTYTYVCDGPTVTLHYRNGIINPINGDVNADGVTDILDVNEVINIILGKSIGLQANADVNGDGVVDIFDVNNVVDIMLFGKTDSIPTLVSINKALDESGEPTFDWNNAKDYVILTVGEAERDAMEGKIVADYNIDSMTRHLYVWENTYVDGDCSGINSFGQLEDHIALTVGNVGWSGFGMIQDGGIDFSMLDDTYVLHFAMKAKSTDMTSHGFGFAQAKFTIGPTAFVDGARVHKLLGDIEHNGEWYYIDIPFSVLRQCADNGDVFPEAKGGAAAYNDNHLWCLSGGVAGSELHIDNIFFYKKKYNQ